MPSQKPFDSKQTGEIADLGGCLLSLVRLFDNIMDDSKAIKGVSFFEDNFKAEKYFVFSSCKF